MGWITTDRINWVFKQKLTNLNQPKLIISPLTDEFFVTSLNVMEKVEVKYHFINQNELDLWLDSLQKNEDPDKSYKSITRKRQA